jgi:transposase
MWVEFARFVTLLVVQGHETNMIKKSQKVVAAPRLVGVEVNPGPDSGQKLSEEQRWAIINEWKTEKRGTRSIARKLNISRTSVQKVIHKYQATGDIQNIAGQGRKRKCSNADINSIRKKAKAGKSAIKIASEETKRRGEPISERTIRRSLKESGLKYLVIKQQEALTMQQKQNRVMFATQRKDYKWENVVFTDEKTFRFGGGEKKAWQDPKNRITRATHRYVRLRRNINML